MWEFIEQEPEKKESMILSLLTTILAIVFLFALVYIIYSTLGYAPNLIELLKMQYSDFCTEISDAF